ncbi:MAG: peptidase S1 [Azospirillaceae bacterium]
MRKFLLAALFLVVAPIAAQAQNWSLNPSFGTYYLDSGYANDPFIVPITAGGTLAAESLSPQCRGSIANRPDVRIMYRASGALPLQFYVRSAYDTTLIVNAPDGSWWCNDDTDGFDPAIFFSRPLSGQYDIWIGSYNRGSGLPASLYVSEFQQRF